MHVINYLGACARLVRLRWELTSCYKELSGGLSVARYNLVGYLLDVPVGAASARRSEATMSLSQVVQNRSIELFEPG